MARRIKGIEATKLFKSIQPDLRWCDECSIPVLYYEKCPLCGNRTRKVKTVPPGDVRPAFEKDIEKTRQAIEYSVGRKAVEKLVPNNVIVLLNKVQAIDAADEVIVGGASIGIREFDIVHRRWIFKPSYLGAKIIVEEKLGFYAVLNISDMHEYQFVERNKILEGDLPDPGHWVAVSNARGDVFGVAKVLSGGDLRISKVWRIPREAELNVKAASFKRVVEAHVERLEKLEKEAIEFLRKASRLGEAVANVSGGKDSTVAAALASFAGIRKGMFIDTGLEFPETVKTVEELSKRIDMHIDILEAGDRFWKVLDLYGPPARDYRWCCKVLKLSILRNVLRPGIRRVSIVGQRRYESTSRALAGKLARSGSTAFDYVAAPIQEWTSLEVFMYIEMRGLPLNPLYRLGYERIGCFLCPTSRLAEFEAVRETHSQLWSRWEDYLSRFAKRHKLPREWIVYGFWRWRFDYPAEMRQLAKRLGLSAEDMIDRIAMSYCWAAREFGEAEDMICVTLSLSHVKELDLNHLAKMFKVVALEMQLDAEQGLILAKAKRGYAKIRSNGAITVCAENEDYLLRLVKRVVSVIYMVSTCIGCGLCVVSCRKQAFSAPQKLETSKCSGCARCTAICPSASHLTLNAIHVVKRVLGVR